MAQHDFPYRIVETKGSNTAIFVNVDICQDLDAVRTRHGNLGLKISVPSYEAPDPSSRRRCRHPSSPPCDSVLRRYCPEGGCALTEPKQRPTG
jgi:hypothetical protein